ncbi:MAG: hypothetical protein HYW57_03775 [Ignavibacteriales bacterium]|nr:hypothetical protein [Ignavibacteriales bacterium]
MILSISKAVWIFFFLFSLPGSTRAQSITPVLEFPHPSLDDPDTYRGYVTRFYRDRNENTMQVYIDQSSGRTVHVWGNAANESIGFTARDRNGRQEPFAWEGTGAELDTSNGIRLLRHTFRSTSPHVSVGLFLLGSMRREREYQYHQKHLLEFGTERKFVEPEIVEFLDLIQPLSKADRKRILSTLEAESMEELRGRIYPTVTIDETESTTTVRILKYSLDGKNRLLLELKADRRDVSVDYSPSMTTFRSLSGKPVAIHVTVGTDAPSLTPLRRNELFNDEFLRFLEKAKTEHEELQALEERQPGSVQLRRLQRFQWLDRQVRSFELLSSREKLMAGLPNFATYFGRDLIMAILMLEPILRPSIQEHAILAILRKLSPRGEVSHEESLGGQAIRENAAAANGLLRQALKAASPDSVQSLIDQVAVLTANLQETREDYKMLDDDFQLPVLVGRYLARPDVPQERKRSFMRQTVGTESVLRLLLRNLAYVTGQTEAYAKQPTAENLLAFPSRGSGRWLSGSWRDSDAGYANGRYAMDINAIWVPEALEATRTILHVLASFGITADSLESVSPDLRTSMLSTYARHPSLLEKAVGTWRVAINHFMVTIQESDIRTRVQSRLEWLPAEERQYWQSAFEQIPIPRQFRFFALALDSNGIAIPIPHTDGGMMLFLRNLAGRDLLEVILAPVVTPYPLGLFVEGLGPLAANDAYAAKKIWEEFQNDRYHSPYVVWGREVNLFLLGLWNHLSATGGSPRIRDAWETIAGATAASGLTHNELWTYRIQNNALVPAQFLLWKNRH